MHLNYSRMTIRDLEEKELEGQPLSEKEIEALRLFRELRLKKLIKAQETEEKFHSKFEYFRELSNVLDYNDFLAEARFNF